MYKLNSLQYPTIQEKNLSETLSLQPLKNNDEYEKEVKAFCGAFGFNQLNTFSFTIEGLMGFMLRLQGNIAISLGESQAIIYAGKSLKALGFPVKFLELNRDGSVNLESLSDSEIDFVFISPYVMDTFVMTSLHDVKTKCKAKIIANMSATQKDIELCDVALFDAYKLTGFQSHSVALHNEELNEQYLAEIDYVGIHTIFAALNQTGFQCTYKAKMVEALKTALNEDVFFFVAPESTLPNSLHFGLKNIKAREIIRTLSLNSILVTNGEGCSLGLSRPSKIIQAMGYSELESRQALSLSFQRELNDEDLTLIAQTIAKKYRQIKALND